MGATFRGKVEIAGQLAKVCSALCKIDVDVECEVTFTCLQSPEVV